MSEHHDSAGGDLDRHLASYRNEFPILEKKLYLNSCSLGAVPSRGLKALASFGDDWADQGTVAWEKWMRKARLLRVRLADLLGVSPRTICLMPNVSAALAVVGSCLEFDERKKVVSSELEFPTVLYQWQTRRESALDLAESPDGISIPAEQYDPLIDSDTELVALSHVLYGTGAIQEVAALTEMAHERGASVLLDTYHSAGIIPVDLADLGVDFAVGGILKWLCGGPGLAFLYVREDLIEEMSPRGVGWFAHSEQFSFDVDFRPASDATKFSFGTPAVAPIYTGLAALEIIGEVGIGAIREKNVALVERLIEGADHLGLQLHAPRDYRRRGGTVFFAVERPSDVLARLVEAEVVVDVRGGKVRVSPHFYNTGREIDRFLELLG
ncbi:MAG: aminotransferase class V-fold PLP-dependent enzyme [Bacillota bacterium]